MIPQIVVSLALLGLLLVGIWQRNKMFGECKQCAKYDFSHCITKAANCHFTETQKNKCCPAACSNLKLPCKNPTTKSNLFKKCCSDRKLKHKESCPSPQNCNDCVDHFAHALSHYTPKHAGATIISAEKNLFSRSQTCKKVVNLGNNKSMCGETLAFAERGKVVSPPPVLATHKDVAYALKLGHSQREGLKDAYSCSFYHTDHTTSPQPTQDVNVIKNKSEPFKSGKAYKPKQHAMTKLDISQLKIDYVKPNYTVHIHGLVRFPAGTDWDESFPCSSGGAKCKKQQAMMSKAVDGHLRALSDEGTERIAVLSPNTLEVMYAGSDAGLDTGAIPIATVDPHLVPRSPFNMNPIVYLPGESCPGIYRGKVQAGGSDTGYRPFCTGKASDALFPLNPDPEFKEACKESGGTRGKSNWPSSFQCIFPRHEDVDPGGAVVLGDAASSKGRGVTLMRGGTIYFRPNARFRQRGKDAWIRIDHRYSISNRYADNCGGIGNRCAVQGLKDCCVVNGMQKCMTLNRPESCGRCGNACKKGEKCALMYKTVSKCGAKGCKIGTNAKTKWTEIINADWQDMSRTEGKLFQPFGFAKTFCDTGIMLLSNKKFPINCSGIACKNGDAKLCVPLKVDINSLVKEDQH